MRHGALRGVSAHALDSSGDSLLSVKNKRKVRHEMPFDKSTISGSFAAKPIVQTHFQIVDDGEASVVESNRLRYCESAQVKRCIKKDERGRLSFARIVIAFVLVHAIYCSPAKLKNDDQPSACRYSRERLLSMQPEKALQILMDLHEDTCLIEVEMNKSENGQGYSSEGDLSETNQCMDPFVANQRKVYDLPGIRTSGADQQISQVDVLASIYAILNGDRWLDKGGWNNMSVPFCGWFGVECLGDDYYGDCVEDPTNDITCPVIALRLSSNNLNGDITKLADALKDLPYLTSIDFSSNNINGNMVDIESPSLLDLDLSQNRITGTIPDFRGIPNIQNLKIDKNPLEGYIPDFSGIPQAYAVVIGDSDKITGPLPNFSGLPNIQTLVIFKTKITGFIPELNYISSVYDLNLNENDFVGTIPDFNSVPNIAGINLSGNRLQGTLPDFIYVPNISGIYVENNLLNGTIPDFNFAPFLSGIDLSNNFFDGTIPDFMNAPYASGLFFGGNILRGTIPNFSFIPSLSVLHLSYNYLNGTVPDFSNIPFVAEIDLSGNFLSGTVPDFSQISYLSSMFLSENQIVDQVPDFKALDYISFIDLSNNKLNGSIPNFSRIYGINRIDLSKNQLSGQIPDFSNIGYIYDINLSANTLNGTLPDFSYIPNLSSINLSKNDITGTVPDFSFLFLLFDLDLSNNELSGSVPDFHYIPIVSRINLSFNELTGVVPDFVNIFKINHLDFGYNRLMGIVPELRALTLLQTLYLDGNEFTFVSELYLPALLVLSIKKNQIEGTFPSLSGCWSLIKIDASRNKISSVRKISPSLLELLDLSKNSIRGTLPDLGNELLTELDLSFNNLDEPLPNWNALTNLKRLDLYENQNLTGPLPLGMNAFNGIAILSALKTDMHMSYPNGLPNVLRFSDTFQIQNTQDTYQCPLVYNPSVGHSMVEMNSTYYDRVMCKCLPGYFGYGGNCIECPRNCDCSDGLSLKYCFASPSVVELKTIIPCPYPLSCDSIIPYKSITTNSTPVMSETCQPGYEGHACSKCQGGYGSQGSSCYECDRVISNVAITVGVVGFCCFIAFLYFKKNSSSGKLRIIMFHMQILSLIPQGMIQSDNANMFTFTLSSFGSIQLPDLSCILDTNDIFDKLVFSFARIPLFIGVGFVCYYFGSEYVRNKAVFITLNLLFFIYYSIAREVFGVFSCSLHDEGESAWYLNAHPWIKCYPSTEEYHNLLALSIPVFVLFMIGFPTLVLWRESIMFRKSSNKLKARFGFLYLPFKENYKYWEFIFIARRIAFSFVTSIIPYTSQIVLYLLIVFIIQMSIWMQKKCQPYIMSIDNQMELTSLYVIFMSFFLSLLSDLLGSQSWIGGFLIVVNSIWLLSAITNAFILPLLRKERPTTHQNELEMTAVQYAQRLERENFH